MITITQDQTIVGWLRPTASGLEAFLCVDGKPTYLAKAQTAQEGEALILREFERHFGQTGRSAAVERAA